MLRKRLLSVLVENFPNYDCQCLYFYPKSATAKSEGKLRLYTEDPERSEIALKYMVFLRSFLKMH